MNALRVISYAVMFAGCALLLGQGPRVTAAVPMQLREEFNRRMERWTAWCNANKFSSTMTSCREYDDIIALGPPAAPLIVEQLRAGNADLLPVVNTLTDGKGALQPRVEQHMELTGTLKERVAFTLAWWDEHKEDWLLPPADQKDG